MSDERKKRILIVDDDELVLNSLETLVSLAGFEVVTASDGKTAIAKIDAAKPDCVILDLILPGESGAEVLKHMQTSDAIGIPVVIITGQGPEHPVVQMAREAPNVSAFLQKPLRRDVVAETIKKALKLLQ